MEDVIPCSGKKCKKISAFGCKTCKMTYCESHNEMHMELYENHEILPIHSFIGKSKSEKSKKKDEEMMKLLCPFCMDIFKDPRISPKCCHNVCYHCILYQFKLRHSFSSPEQVIKTLISSSSPPTTLPQPSSSISSPLSPSSSSSSSLSSSPSLSSLSKLDRFIELSCPKCGNACFVSENDKSLSDFIPNEKLEPKVNEKLMEREKYMAKLCFEEEDSQVIDKILEFASYTALQASEHSQKSTPIVMEPFNKKDLKFVGHGSQGSVYSLQQDDGTTIVVKIGSLKFSYEREVEIGYFGHPSLTHLLGHYTVNSNFIQEYVCVFEYMENLDLYGYINNKSNPRLSRDQKMDICISVSEGLQFMHSKGYIHRDIKAENIFLDKNLKAKIGDFGLCRSVHSEMTGGVGTTLWKAPEMLSGAEDYDTATDVYAFGILMWEVFAEKAPFSNYGTLPTSHKDWMDDRIKGKELVLEKQIPPIIRALIRKCTALDPQKRPAMSQLSSLLKMLKLSHMMREEISKEKNLLDTYINPMKKINDTISSVAKENQHIVEEYEKIALDQCSQIENMESRVISLIKSKTAEAKGKIKENLENQKMMFSKQSAMANDITQSINHILKEMKQKPNLLLNEKRVENICNYFDNMYFPEVGVSEQKLEFDDDKLKSIFDNLWTLRESYRQIIPKAIHLNEDHNKSKLKTPTLESENEKSKLFAKMSLVAGSKEAGYYNSLYKNGSFYLFSKAEVTNIKFNNPEFLRYDPKDSKLWISDRKNHVLRSIKQEVSFSDKKQKDTLFNVEVGNPLEKPNAFQENKKNMCTLFFPRGFDWDSEGNLFICSGNGICKVDKSNGHVSLFSGKCETYGYHNASGKDSRFWYLAGMCIDRWNDRNIIYCCDEFNRCIRSVDPLSNAKTVAGIPKDLTKVNTSQSPSDDYADGPLDKAKFKFPWDIVLEPKDHNILYVSDHGNKNIRKIDLNNNNGTVSTLLGNDMNGRPYLKHCPRQIFVNGKLLVVVCESVTDHVITVHTETGHCTKLYMLDGGILNNPFGVSYNNLTKSYYISDKHAIKRLKPCDNQQQLGHDLKSL